MIKINWRNALSYLVENKVGFTIAYGLSVRNLYWADHVLFTEALWNQFMWNPIDAYLDNNGQVIFYPVTPAPDPTASPKPTWTEMVDAYYSYLLKEQPISYKELTTRFHFRNASHDSRSKLAELKDLHTGSGMEHMVSLTHQVENSNLAGKRIAPLLLRTKDQKIKSFYTQKEVRVLLEELAKKENIVESAHNKVMIKLEKAEAIYDDETRPAKERYEAGQLIQEMTRVKYYYILAGEEPPDKGYEDYLQVEIDAYDADALPTDINELRQVWLERLEAVATQKIADLKNAATQHGVDLPESCIDQVNATQRVANKSQKGKIELTRATTGTEMKDLFDTYKFRIESIKVKNVPKWKQKDGESSYFENDGTSPLELSGRSFEFVAFSPATDPPIPGLVAAESAEAWTSEGGIFDQISAALDNNKIRFTVDNDVPADTQLRLRLGARNLCGPSHLYINLTVTALPT